MTIDDLAREVGIGKGSIYLHFASKEEIALSHIDRIVERVKDELGRIAKSDASSAEKLKLMIAARVLLRFDSVQHYTQNLNDLLADLRVKHGQSSGNFKSGDAAGIAETILLSTNSLLPFSLTTRELGERAEIEEKTTRIANLLLDGLSNT
jgi:AcrR family transcriptional regulator